MQYTNDDSLGLICLSLDLKNGFQKISIVRRYKLYEIT